MVQQCTSGHEDSGDPYDVPYDVNKMDYPWQVHKKTSRFLWIFKKNLSSQLYWLCNNNLINLWQLIDVTSNIVLLQPCHVSIVFHCILFYFIVLYCIVLYFIVFYSIFIVFYSIFIVFLLYFILLYFIVFHCISL